MPASPASPAIPAALVALLLAAPGAAQEAPDPTGPGDAAEPGAATPPPAEENEPFDPELRFSGWAQLDYRRADSGGDPELTPTHEFIPRRVRLRLGGRVAPRISFRLGVQGDRATDTASVLDVAVTFEMAPWLGLRVGQFKYDFDVVGRGSTASTLFADRPFVTQAVAGGLDGRSTPVSGSGSFRDRGASLLGELDAGALKIEYAAGVFQGAGRRSDNNDGATVVSRVRLWPRPGLAVSGGLLSGPTADPGAAFQDGFSAWTAALVYETPRLLGRFEYYDARRESEGRVEDVDGFYLLGVVAPHPDLDVMVRYQTYRDPAALADGGRAGSVDLGVEWYFAREARNRGTSVAANLMLRHADDVELRGFTLLNDGRGDPLTRGSRLGPAFVLRVQFEF